MLGNTLFWSVHLSSRKELNSDQVLKVKKTLLKYQKLFPYFNFVLGGDLNSNIFDKQ